MENSFSQIEVRLLRGMLTTSADEQIAYVLDKPLEEVSALINEITGGNRPRVKSRRGPKPKAKDVKEAKRRGRPRSAAPKPAKTPKVKAEKVKPESPDRKEVKRLIARQEAERQAARRKAEQPKFQTRQVDYSQMARVQIDHKTSIYIKPGQCPKKAKANYLKLMKKH